MPRIRIQLVGVKELVIEIDDATLASAIAGLVGTTDDEDEEESAGDTRADTTINTELNPPMFGFTPWSTNQTHAWMWEERESHMNHQPKHPETP